MRQRFDLIVVGTGAAGSTPAFKCRSAGWHVAIIDSRAFGGTCALRGRDPKKVLVGAADLREWDRRMREKGSRQTAPKSTGPSSSASKESLRTPYLKTGTGAFERPGSVHFTDMCDSWNGTHFRSAMTRSQLDTSSSHPELCPPASVSTESTV